MSRKSSELKRAGWQRHPLWPIETVQEAKRLYFRGYNITRIGKLPHMPHRLSTIYDWKDREDWDGELERIQERRKEKRIERISDKLADMDVRQLDILFDFTTHIGRHLSTDYRLDPSIIQSLMAAFDKVIKNERLIKGDVTERKENLLDGEFSLEQVIYASADVDLESDASSVGESEEEVTADS